MTVTMFEAYLDELPALRAERLLDAAHAAHPSKAWSDDMIRLIKRSAEGAARQAGALFTVDGKAVGVDGLRRWFRRTIGGGLTA